MRREREGDRDRDRDRDRERRGRAREKTRDGDHKDRDRDKEKDRARDRDRPRESKKPDTKEIDANGDGRDKVKKEKDRRERHRDERDRDRDKDHERDRDRDREKEVKERQRERKRRDVERAKDRDKKDDSGHDREREVDDAKDCERRRRKREDEQRESRTEQREGRAERDKQREGEAPREERSKEEDDDNRERDWKRRRKEETSEPDDKAKKEEGEGDPEEEQRKLEEEMEKRRRRVQEWQEHRRRKEEEERKKSGDPGEGIDNLLSTTGKAWTLEGDESDEEDAVKADDSSLIASSVSGLKESAQENGDVTMADEQQEEAGKLKEEKGQHTDISFAKEDVDEEVDPLDAFMNSTILPEVEKLNAKEPVETENTTPSAPDLGEGKGTIAIGNGNKSAKKGTRNATGRILPGEDSESEEDNEEVEEDAEEDDDEFFKRVKKTKAEKLALVDHSKVPYMTFRKSFYIEVKEITRMTPEEVSVYRKELELKIRGKDVPRPIKTWNQTGLSSKVLDVIKKLGFEKPMPIQVQALPIIMNGRDCIGIAKTGSGKTLGFVLPMLRHIKDQAPLAPGDGPIGLIMAPTRELVQQIYNDIKKFSKALGMTAVPVYGGSGVAQQISDLKRGTDIVVCTPGRMIDILCTSSGKITNLRRVTYLVLDEADRMFDMGFEPQITRIVQNTRPDRQTVLFSATFPRQVEVLARKVLNKPIEIQVGGRSVVNKDITQTVEVRPDRERFLRLLELLGEWFEKGKILVFVHSQDKCDSIFKDLVKSGYPCLSLHGAKDQTDRESTITDFKSNICNLLIATSVAARGLDVKELELVVNYDVPNHYEDYVHRVGRTGRAGRKGCAVTFIAEDEARYAPDLVKALELSEQSVPEDLKKLADDFMAKVNQGTEQSHGSGYGGSGFKFNEEEDEALKAAKKAQAKEYGFEDDEKSESDSDDDGIRKAGGDLAQVAAAAAMVVAAQGVSGISLPGMVAPVGMQGVSSGLPNIAGVPLIPGLGFPGLGVGGMPSATDAAAKAAAFAAVLQHNLSKIQTDAMPEHYEAEFEINDFPQHARWKVTHKDSLGPISDWTGAAITTRGQYFPPGKISTPGERKLYLFIEGPTENSVKKAKTEIKRILEECTASAISLPSGGQPGKYSVL